MIKNITDNQKSQILELCKNTFSWGDYIDSVWDFWIKEGNFFCIYDGDVPVGICHGSISKPAKQLWIEGIRIHQKFRRKHLATQLITKLESIGIKNSCDTSCMFIDSNNVRSLLLAKNLNYNIDQIWNYHLIRNVSQPQDTSVRFVDSIQDISDFDFKSSKFIQAWRLYPLHIFLDDLISTQSLVSVRADSLESIATIIPTRNFNGILLVTVLAGNASGINEIIKFAQNYALQNNISQIQLLTRQKITRKNSTQNLVFNLVKKTL